MPDEGEFGDCRDHPRASNRIEHGLGGREEAVAIRPPVIVRCAILVLLRQVKRVRCVLGRPRPALVSAVFAHKQPAIQRMIIGRETKSIAVAIAPRKRLDRSGWIGAVKPRSQD